MKKLSIVVLTLVTGLAACDAIDAANDALNDHEKEPSKAVIKTALTLANDSASLAPQPFGHVRAEGLQSLKYYITSMGICQTAEIDGTGFNMGPNCIVLYEAPSDERYQNNTQSIPSFEDYVAYAEAARADNDNPYFIDLMNPDSRATMARTVTLTTDQVGSYEYGFVYWYYPIKIKAEVPLEDGTILYTHDGETKYTDHGNGAGNVYTQSDTPFTEGPAEEAVFVQQNGGNWFKFQSPFTITEADISGNTEFALKLAFNPEGTVKGIGKELGSNNNSFVDGDINVNGASNQFAIPLLDLAPVVHRVNESALRESYVFDVSTPTEPANGFQIRYDLYYAEPRPEAVLAVETKTLATQETIGIVSYGWSVSFVEADANGALTFKRWDNTNILTGFTRGAAAGDIVTATLHCEGAASISNWCDENNENQLTGTLVGIYPVGE